MSSLKRYVSADGIFIDQRHPANLATTRLRGRINHPSRRWIVEPDAMRMARPVRGRLSEPKPRKRPNLRLLSHAYGRGSRGDREKLVLPAMVPTKRAAWVEEVRAEITRMQIREKTAQILLTGFGLKPKGQAGLISSKEFVQRQRPPGAWRIARFPAVP